MRDHLLDIVQHTHGLEVIDFVKVVGTDKETKLEAVAENKSVVLQAKFAGIIPEFIGTFGMPNLSKLNTILNIPEYKEDAVITFVRQTKDNEEFPSGINFVNKIGDFKNEYRLMRPEIVNGKLGKSLTMANVTWNIDVVPSVASIQKLKFQASANSEETTFIAKTDKNDLKFYFGDHSSHAGNFVFQSGVTGSLSKGWHWPIAPVISILNLPGDKTLKISDHGVMMITVNSGIAVYNYMLPAQNK